MTFVVDHYSQPPTCTSAASRHLVQHFVYIEYPEQSSSVAARASSIKSDRH